MWDCSVAEVVTCIIVISKVKNWRQRERETERDRERQREREE